jgi:methylthioribose-1-phosphate isomerase
MVKDIRPVQWVNGRLRLLDQRRLPAETVYLDLDHWTEAVAAIQTLTVRGAPAIGVAGGYSLVLAANEYKDLPEGQFWENLDNAAYEIANARPTAVNLAWAVERCRRAVSITKNRSEVIEQLLTEAQAIHCEDIEGNRRIGEHGSALLPSSSYVLTHCNAGALATGGYGTALGVVRTAWKQGRIKGVIATETRPLLQGARLTAWELVQEGIPVTLVVDGAVGHLLKQGQINAVVVGADRIAANGDVANKIGTYSLAVLAHNHGIPVYVAAPVSTVDLRVATGADIPIEERSAEEVIGFRTEITAPEGVGVYNPAFDVTPAELVTAIITEIGVIRPPYGLGLREAKTNYG